MSETSDMSGTSETSGTGDRGHAGAPAPRLELPSRQEWGLPARPRGTGGGGRIAVALLVIVIGLQAASMLLVRAPRHDAGEAETAETAAPAGSTAGLSARQLRDLSARLQRNHLYSAAATAQEELLETIPASARDERRKALVTLAMILVKARRYEDAIVRLYQAELLEPDAETQNTIDRQVTLCLQKLGKHDELAYELADRTSPGWKPGVAGPGEKAAGEEVARIGIEAITRADLDAMIADEIDRQLAAIPGLAGAERESYRKRLLEELRAPQKRLQKLRQLVTQRVLFREGMEQELDRDPAVVRELESLREQLIARQVVLKAMAERVHVSESDLRNAFQANPGRYARKASARVRLALLDSESKAAELLAKAATEADFRKIARQGAGSEALRRDEGLVSAPVVEGEPFPGLGDVPELTAAVLATDAGKPIARPVKVGEHWAIAFVIEKTPRHVPSFEEAREAVTRDYVRSKEMEVQQQLIDELFRKHAATIRTEAFIDLPAGGGKEKGGAKDAAGSGTTSDTTSDTTSGAGGAGGASGTGADDGAGTGSREVKQ